MQKEIHLSDDALIGHATGHPAGDLSAGMKEHLFGCKACTAKLLRAVAASTETVQSAPLEGQGRRRERRLATDEVATMQRLSPFSRRRSQIRILDVSANGLKLLVPERLNRGTLIQVRMKGNLIVGEVRYSRTSAAGFYAGVQIQAMFQAAPQSAGLDDRR